MQSWSNYLWQRWSCWLVHCPSWKCHWPDLKRAGLFQGISSWTPFKPQHSNLNPNPLANHLWCIDFLTPPTPLIILTYSLPSLNLLCHSKTDSRFIQDGWKAVWSILYVSVSFCQSLKQNFTAHLSSKGSSGPVCIFENSPAETIRV